MATKTPYSDVTVEKVVGDGPGGRARLNHSQRAALLPVVQSRILGGAR